MFLFRLFFFAAQNLPSVHTPFTAERQSPRPAPLGLGPGSPLPHAMGMGVTGSPVPVHWVPTPSRPLAWGALPILPFNCTSKETTKVELMSALVEGVNAVGDVVDGDVEGEGAVEDVYPPTDAFTTTAPSEELWARARAREGPRSRRGALPTERSERASWNTQPTRAPYSAGGDGD